MLTLDLISCLIDRRRRAHLCMCRESSLNQETKKITSKSKIQRHKMSMNLQKHNCTHRHSHAQSRAYLPHSKCHFKLDLSCCGSRHRYCGRNHLCTLYMLLSGKETVRCSVCVALFVLSCQEKYFTVISMWVTLSPLREKRTHLGCVCHGNTLSSRCHYHTHLHVLGGTE